MVLTEKKQVFKCKTRVFLPNNRLFAPCLPIIFLVHQEFGVIDIINVVVEDNKPPL